MEENETLYDAFGELLYAIIKADAVVETESKKALQELLCAYPFGEKVFWSFSYESGHSRSVEEAYDRALRTFTEYGAAKVYGDFFEILQAITIHKVFTLTERKQKLVIKFEKELMRSLSKDASDQTDKDDG